jgi:hypothetical protein
LSILEEPIDSKLTIPIQDGGNFSNTILKKRCSPMLRMERLLMYKEEEMKKVVLFKYIRRTVLLVRNGLLSMKTKRAGLKLEV